MQQTEFVFYNSLWRNLVLLIISAIFVLIPVVVSPNDPNHHWERWEWLDIVLFGMGTALFGFRVLDRQPQVIVDQGGIEKCRSRIGRIPWSEISAYRFQHVKGNLFITLSLHNREVWKRKSPSRLNFVAHFLGSKKLELTMSLQNMSVDEVALQEFMATMVKGNSLNA